MTDPNVPQDVGDDDVGRDDDAVGMPRWVKVSGAIVIALVLIVIVAMLVGGGNHGPGRHSVELGAIGEAWCARAC